ncbi:hypothetical protein CANTEDRAFT_116236 [Yamadazyma tenuis ATCC 10573]|uniref:Uncharacterized protein n=1 Tax=Candida tenuis (strain ATCC 10573 / BCRC 21748 / CBS 615 / JCM 9827 / NBRC 10315 / NRRL Y-1498 / VKM Y-70) TaxID=590646 RepID=G3BCI8_CANTC|nr:uncharacterized protein CANTEDRAFT_116236 [Yamadazyma tenuis ATCC 10573]XP_006690255.1 uncharacterized protein CANTEDRAFT_116236 [Yamadazyma tenuis ATCC 10573]EGV61040.1 hypothetical protein CANTEDRAFT_116236 [Yamadazyma tenuis ATCC 10573]EGV61041.1 hypothetical protein CANTEDRAFT_116236 [Yamadazyma tenuis ATCC 10573]
MSLKTRLQSLKNKLSSNKTKSSKNSTAEQIHKANKRVPQPYDKPSSPGGTKMHIL